MHLTEFQVLLVDDEPDVLEVSRLAMRRFRIFGLPLRLHTASSKAEAIEVLNGLTLGRPDISMAAVALIDVVMETEHAGLELCDHIRNVMKNPSMQLFIRTGQPGAAPERAVLDRYDIQGYLNKAEVTEDKLYTVVKAGLREHYFTALALGQQDLLAAIAPHAASRSRIVDSIKNWQRLVRLNLKGMKVDTVKNSECYIVGDEVFGGVEDWADAAAALQRRAELVAKRSPALNEDGDRAAVDGNDLLLEIAPTATNASIQYMLRGNAPPPDWEVLLLHRYLRIFSALWNQAR